MISDSKTTMNLNSPGLFIKTFDHEVRSERGRRDLFKQYFKMHDFGAYQFSLKKGHKCEEKQQQNGLCEQVGCITDKLGRYRDTISLIK